MRKKQKKQPKNSFRKGKCRIKPVHSNSAGIDVGADEVYVSTTLLADEQEVKCFGTTTPDLEKMANMLVNKGVSSVAMESTGVYWIPVYSVLEDKGIDVWLVDAREVRCVPGRKSDVSDAQWIQQLHTYGLLSKAVVLPKDNRKIRCLLRQRDNLIRTTGQTIQRMQKALTEMNIRLDRVLSDITGKTGMLILRAIIGGETNPEELVNFRHKNCKFEPEDFVKALTGKYTDEQLCILEQHLDLYDYLNQQISDCDKRVRNILEELKEVYGTKPIKKKSLIEQLERWKLLSQITAIQKIKL